MKQTLRSFITFSRTERIGLIALLSLLILLIAVRATMHFFITPPPNPLLEQRLLLANSKLQIPNSNSGEAPDSRLQIPNTPINLNTADSLTLLSIDGIGPAMAHKIIARRPFTSYKQLLHIPRFPHALADSLKNHTVLK